MSRGLTSDEITALSASVVRPALFFEGIFNPTVLRLWSGNRDITFNSNTFLGNGWLRNIGSVTEIADIRAAGIRVNFNGVNQTLLSIVLNESKHKGTGKLWLGLLNEAGALIGPGYLLFSGKLESPEINEDAEGATISIGYESILASLLRRRESRYTDQNQRAFYPDDAGLQYVVQAQDWSGYWGKGENKLNLRRRDRR